MEHHADHTSNSSSGYATTSDLHWHHTTDTAGLVAAPEAGIDARPSHWISAWQDAEHASREDKLINLRIDQAIDDERSEFTQGWQDRGGGITRRRNLGHRLWHLYRQHAHKESLALSTRVRLADTLAQTASLVTTNKTRSPSSKALRYLFGRRIDAILQDCHLFLANMQATRPSQQQLALSHSNLGIALLQPIAMALQARPISALKVMDDVLLRCRPDIYGYKTDPLLPRDYLSPINLTLQTIFDSIKFELSGPLDTHLLTNSVTSQPDFFQDDGLLDDIRHGVCQQLESKNPISDSIKWFITSPHAFLLSHPAFRVPRGMFLHCLSQAEDPHLILDQLSQEYDPLDPAFIYTCNMMLRSLLSKGSEATLEFYDDLWTRGVPMSSRLIQRIIMESKGQESSARLETLFHRISRSSTMPKTSTKLLRTVTRCWAMRNRLDRVNFFLAVLQKRKPRGHDNFVRLVMMDLAAARGDVKVLHEKLAEVHDFEARHVDQCAAGRSPLDGKAYGLLIKACNRADDVDLAEYYLTKALERGIAPRSSDFNLIIDLHIRKSNVDAALAVFEQMKEFGVQPDKYTYTILIHGFALRRDPDSAAHALRAMIDAGKTPDRITYAALLNCFVESGIYDAAIRLFAWMQNHRDVRIRPTIEVCNIILKAYVLSAMPVQKVMQFVSNVRKMYLSPNANTYALMLQSACDAGFMDVAEEVFSEAERCLPNVTGSGSGQGANIYHFTIMIQGYLRLGDHAEAKDYFDEMQQRKLSPSSVTWSVMVHSYAHSENEANYDLACTLVSQLVADESKRAFRPSSWSAPAALGGKDKTATVAEKPFENHRLAAKHSPSFEALYTVLMVAQAQRGEPDKVERTLKTLARSTPDLSVYAMTPLLDAYRRAGDVDSALRLFDQIYASALELASSKRHRVYAYSSSSDASGQQTDGAGSQDLAERRRDASSRNVLCLPISIMIDLLSTVGRHEEISKMWARAKKDGFGFDSDNWNHLAASMARAGQLEEALSVVEHVLYQDPPNAWMRSRHQDELHKRDKADEDVEEEDGELAARRTKDDAEREAAEAVEMSKEVEAFDPLPADARLDPAVVHRSDATSPPSTPPSRRHQGRSDDDPYVELPFDRPDFYPSAEEDGMDGEVERSSHEQVARDEFVEPSAYYLDSETNVSLTRDLKSSTEHPFSPWYAHFETMEAISRGLANVREPHKVISLLDKFRTAASLLDLHERKVEIIRERQKEEAVRSARDLIDGRA
ncbi:uncharacterized protein UTRI_01235_B [Ustilago trichophora]|uniref:Pentacotripeptide-repeat region of PRORP domain-containing protein n=1 Tax=Ustilago trichophora TaxID=86804 RepID=A0A5C3DXJ3_9BASI|nr:uncharacterized protein UTRI_01235_B [Ustilago trichophora]